MIKVNSISLAWAEAQAKYIESVQNEPYYDAQKDIINQELYYSTLDFEKDDIPEQIHGLLVRTHSKQLDYSPHQYVYPWVDLQENFKLKSLYSGAGIDPLKAIDQDLRLLQSIQESGISSNERVIFNTEHVVPQSWFEGTQPMKGDLHHLFACEPACNSMRSNFPYHDFESYAPEIQAESVRNGCGMAEQEKFEPEYGKGIAARAVFYFAVRYKKVINIEEKMDLKLLQRWHEEYPVTVYEKHRNAAIQALQGNRNPFIDFPDHAKEIIG
ncbi:endonuclease I [Sporosarcina globispora]|uniref:Endonuclease I n=1 Tax=Sporosarcina globispora TaxID=1459 RepID=A0A0M0GF65_SPOGL|nr:endonuclease [Sporosarcina globispora]KON88484.1 endonuclease I [Sporosarcina globispora]